MYQTKIILICRNSSLRVFKFQYRILLISGIEFFLIFQDPVRPVFVCRGFFPRLSRSFLFLSLPVRGILPRQLLYPRYDCSSPRRSSFAGLVQEIPIAEFHTEFRRTMEVEGSDSGFIVCSFCMMSYTRCFKSFMSFFMSKSILYRISRSVAKL